MCYSLHSKVKTLVGFKVLEDVAQIKVTGWSVFEPAGRRGTLSAAAGLE